jgi:hypothetical protein
MTFTLRTAGYTKWDHKRNEDIHESKIKIKIKIDNIQNYQKKWNECTNNEYRKNPKANLTLSAKRTKINLTSNEEMGGKYEIIKGSMV